MIPIDPVRYPKLVLPLGGNALIRPGDHEGPKIESAIDFLSQGGRRVLITQLESLAAALQGHTGTHIFP